MSFRVYGLERNLGPNDYEEDYRQKLSKLELIRKHLDDGSEISKDTKVFCQFSYEDAMCKRETIRDESLLLTVKKIEDDLITLEIERQSGIQHRSGVVKSCYSYIWDRKNNIIQRRGNWPYFDRFIECFFSTPPQFV